MSGERVVVDRMMLKLICLMFFAAGLFIGGCVAVIMLAQTGYLQ